MTSVFEVFFFFLLLHLHLTDIWIKPVVPQGMTPLVKYNPPVFSKDFVRLLLLISGVIKPELHYLNLALGKPNRNCTPDEVASITSVTRSLLEKIRRTPFSKSFRDCLQKVLDIDASLDPAHQSQVLSIGTASPSAAETGALKVAMRLAVITSFAVSGPALATIISEAIHKALESDQEQGVLIHRSQIRDLVTTAIENTSGALTDGIMVHLNSQFGRVISDAPAPALPATDPLSQPVLPPVPDPLHHLPLPVPSPLPRARATPLTSQEREAAKARKRQLMQFLSDELRHGHPDKIKPMHNYKKADLLVISAIVKHTGRTSDNVCDYIDGLLIFLRRSRGAQNELSLTPASLSSSSSAEPERETVPDCDAVSIVDPVIDSSGNHDDDGVDGRDVGNEVPNDSILESEPPPRRRTCTLSLEDIMRILPCKQEAVKAYHDLFPRSTDDLTSWSMERIANAIQVELSQRSSSAAHMLKRLTESQKQGIPITIKYYKSTFNFVDRIDHLISFLRNFNRIAHRFEITLLYLIRLFLVQSCNLRLAREANRIGREARQAQETSSREQASFVEDDYFESLGGDDEHLEDQLLSDLQDDLEDEVDTASDGSTRPPPKKRRRRTLLDDPAASLYLTELQSFFKLKEEEMKKLWGQGEIDKALKIQEELMGLNLTFLTPSTSSSADFVPSPSPSSSTSFASSSSASSLPSCDRIALGDEEEDQHAAETFSSFVLTVRNTSNEDCDSSEPLSMSVHLDGSGNISASSVQRIISKRQERRRRQVVRSAAAFSEPRLASSETPPSVFAQTRRRKSRATNAIIAPPQ